MPHGAAVWDAAHRLIGARFRLHGRDAATGLDCVGVVAAAHRDAGVVLAPVPRAYPLRGVSPAAVEAWLDAAGIVRVHDERTGDLLLADMGRGQWHLLIAGPPGAGCIHAHAGLRRVVHTPGPPPGRPMGRYRWRGDA